MSSALPCRAVSGGFRWRLLDAGWLPAARAVADRLQGVPGAASFETLKEGEGRTVLRGALGERRWIAKGFRMRTLRQKLWRFRRHAHAEVAHLIEARRRGIRAPGACGLGWRRRGPFVVSSVALVEDLEGYAPLTRVGGLPREEQRAMLRPVADALLALHAAACNHIDLGAANIFVAEDGSGDVRVIDFMHARFLPRPSANALAFHAAYLADSLVRCGVPEDLCREWAADLLARAAAPPAACALFEDCRGRRLSRRERFAIS